MSFRSLNGVKDIQVALQELGLYVGEVDGIWGRGSHLASQTLFNQQASSRSVKGLTTIPMNVSNDQAILGYQTNLKRLGLYQGTLDALWGDGCRTGLAICKEDFRSTMKLPRYGLCWSRKVGTRFTEMVVEWVAKVGLPPQAADYLMAIMAFESAGTFDPAKKNMAGAEAYGLIQFMSAAAADLRVSLNTLKNMSQLDQLLYVFRYFEMRMRAYKIKTLEDFYLAVFYPGAIGKSADTVIFESGTKGYLQNRGFDADKDGKLTVGEINVRIYQAYYDGMLVNNRSVING